MAPPQLGKLSPHFVAAPPHTAEVPIRLPGERVFQFWASLSAFLTTYTMSLVIMFKDKETILCFNFIFSIMCPSPMHSWAGSAVSYSPTHSEQSSVEGG